VTIRIGASQPTDANVEAGRRGMSPRHECDGYQEGVLPSDEIADASEE